MAWAEGRGGSERRKPGGYPDLDANEVELHVQNGEVILGGTIGSRDARWLAGDLANSVSGVREVRNRLKVAR